MEATYHNGKENNKVVTILPSLNHWQVSFVQNFPADETTFFDTALDG